MKLFLVASVVVLGGAILWAGSGQVGPFISSVVRGFGGFVSQVGNVAGSPTPTRAPEVPDAPSIQAPEQAATNRATTDVTVDVPSAITGREGYTVRLYVTLADAEPVVLVEKPVGGTAVQVIRDVPLAPGRNDIQAAVVGPAGEGDRSAIATWILDTTKPKVTVISPKDNAQVKGSDATVKGKSQAGAEIRLQNAANGAIATTAAGTDGLWTAKIAVGDGANVITVMATDPAGNVNTATLNLRKGSGKVTAVLVGSAYRFQASKLPRSITLTVTVTGPDGGRMAGATTLFTVSVPGIEAIVSGEIATNGSGVATFKTSVPSGAVPGSGLATVLVSTASDGNATDRQVLTITE
jgi:hypothetical protein